MKDDLTFSEDLRATLNYEEMDAKDLGELMGDELETVICFIKAMDRTMTDNDLEAAEAVFQSAIAHATRVQDMYYALRPVFRSTQKKR